jgi:superoxide dismutase, Cu-Zn family
MCKTAIVTFFLALTSLHASAAEMIEIEMFGLTAEGTGAKIGTITAKNTPDGTEFTPDLNGLAPGEHGFHIHQDANCGPADQEGVSVPGLAAKGHFDPDNTGVHSGPNGNGHLGDLPVLTADQDGRVSQAVVAPRIQTSDLRGRALIIHAGGDNYSDIPNKLGGGGARVACGVIP